MEEAVVAIHEHLQEKVLHMVEAKEEVHTEAEDQEQKLHLTEDHHQAKAEEVMVALQEKKDQELVHMEEVHTAEQEEAKRAEAEHMEEVQLQEKKDQELADEVQQTEEVHTVEIHEDHQEDNPKH